MALSIPSRPEIVSARSLVIAAGGGRDLAWPHQRVAAELLAQAIARAVAHTSLGSIASALVVAFPGGSGTASLVQEARRMASRSQVPISVAQVSPSAGLWVVPAGVGRS